MCLCPARLRGKIRTGVPATSTCLSQRRRVVLLDLNLHSTERAVGFEQVAELLTLS